MHEKHGTGEARARTLKFAAALGAQLAALSCQQAVPSAADDIAATRQPLTTQDIAPSLGNLVSAAAHPPSNGCVVVQSYYAGAFNAADGSGGVFCWDASSTAAVDGGTVMPSLASPPGQLGCGNVYLPAATGSGRWLRQYSGPVSVRWYGARGNGTCDDRPAINMAIVSAAHVLVPPGTYSVSEEGNNPWAIHLASGTHVTGAGSASIIKLADNQANGFVRLMATDGVGAFANIQISDLQLDGNRGHQPNDPTNQDHGILLSSCNACVLTRLRIHDTHGDGIMMFPGASGFNEHAIVSNNVVYDVGRVGINMYGAENSVVSGNTVYNIPNDFAFKVEQDPGSANPVQGLVFADNSTDNVAVALGVGGTTDGRPGDIVISANTFRVNSGAGNACLSFRSVDHLAIKGNVCDGGQNKGMVFDASVSNVVISGNTIRNVSGTGNIGAVYMGGGALDPLTSFIITDNLFDNDGWGIFIQNVGGSGCDNKLRECFRNSSISIANNIFTRNTNDIVVTDAIDLAITGNVLSSNVTGSIGINVTSHGNIGLKRLTIANNSFGGHLPAANGSAGMGLYFGPFNAVVDYVLVGNNFAGETTPVAAGGPQPAGLVEIANNAGYVAGGSGAHSTRNASGTVVISGLNTSAQVPFSLPEPDVAYRVGATVSGVTGSIGLPPSVWVSAKTTSQFTVNLASAPGAGNSVSIDWQASR